MGISYVLPFIKKTHGFWHEARRFVFPFGIALLCMRAIDGWIPPIKSYDAALVSRFVQFVLFFQVGIHLSNAIYSVIGIFKLMKERLGQEHDLD